MRRKNKNQDGLEGLSHSEREIIENSRFRKKFVLLLRNKNCHSGLSFPPIKFISGEVEKPDFIYPRDETFMGNDFTIVSLRYYYEFLKIAQQNPGNPLRNGECYPNQKLLKELNLVQPGEIAEIDWKQDSRFFEDDLKRLDTLNKLIEAEDKSQFQKAMNELKSLKSNGMKLNICLLFRDSHLNMIENLGGKLDIFQREKMELVGEYFNEIAPKRPEKETDYLTFSGRNIVVNE